MISIGFTGTREMITDDQWNWIYGRLRSYIENKPEVHVGACVGADETAHRVASYLGYTVVVHPPTNPSLASLWSIENATFLRPSQSYLTRNREIVDASDLLLAVPKSTASKGGGTWYTIRYARTKGVPRIVYPSTEAETIA